MMFQKKNTGLFKTVSVNEDVTETILKERRRKKVILSSTNDIRTLYNFLENKRKEA